MILKKSIFKNRDKCMNYNVIITKKKMKNLIIKITDEGEVKVSAPKYLTNKEIQEFISQKKEWIEERLTHIQNKIKTSSFTLESNNIAYLLGEKFTINVVFSSREDVDIDSKEKIIMIFCNGNTSSDRRKEIFENYMKNKLWTILVNLNEKFSLMTGHVPAQIKIRNMKTLWGSCNIKKKTITYNYKLIEKPIEAIEYVVLHEISHIPFPHHQKEFWDYIESFMPDWKARKNLLKK